MLIVVLKFLQNKKIDYKFGAKKKIFKSTNMPI